MSKVEKSIYGQFKFILQKHSKEASKKELKLLVRWICKNFPDTSADDMGDIKFWDSLRAKLYQL